MIEAPPPPRLSRFIAVDAARGAALTAMVVYHFVWDLGFLQLVEPPPADALGWRVFARIIAASFLFLVGVSLALAARDGLRWPAFRRRLAVIVGAAALVSAGTAVAAPGQMVVFGILHHIAAASVLALPFLRAPVSVVIAAAVVVLVLPFALPFVGDGLWLWTLGLGDSPRASVDHVPLLPWFGAVLCGVAAGRLAPPERLHGLWRGSRLAGLLARAGRWSLPIYLLHQPVLIGLLSAVAFFVAAPQDDRQFAADCRANCAIAGRPSELCRAACACTVRELRAAGLWDRLAALNLAEADRAQVEEVARACVRTR